MDEGVDIIGEPQSRTHATTKGHLDDSDRETSIGYVVSGSDHSVARRSDEDLAQHLLSLKIDQRWVPPEMSADVCPLATGKLIAGIAEQIDELTVRSPGHRRSAIDIVDNA